MFKLHKKFLLCWRYEKDIWGYIIAKHKTVNLGWTKVRPNVENVPHLAKSKWLLQDFSKWLNFTRFKGLNFSFEIVWRARKRRPKKMKNWMWFFFLAWILWIFYGSLKWQTFKNLCNICIWQNAGAMFSFLKIFEFWLPTFLYRRGFAPSFLAAKDWISKGFIFINNKVEFNVFKTLKIYDFVTFSPLIWDSIIDNLGRLLYYGSKAARRWRCISSKIWSLKKIARAHFIGSLGSMCIDYWTFSFYLWKEALPTSFKFYFSLNLANILKFVTI